MYHLQAILAGGSLVGGEQHPKVGASMDKLQAPSNCMSAYGFISIALSAS